MFRRNKSPTPQPLGIIALCLGVVATLWAALFFEVDQLQKSAVTQAGRDATNLAMAFRENVRRTVSAIDQLMVSIIATDNEFGRAYDIPSWVGSSPLLSGMSVQVAILGPHGIMVNSTLGVTGTIDLSDRPHFRYHLAPAAPQPYISVPVVGRVSGQWSIQITRRMTRADGSFGGVLVVSVDPFYFSRFFESVDLGRGGVVDLIGRDGIIRARRARDSQEIGQDVGDTDLFKRTQTSSVGSAVVRSRLDGVTRVFGYSSVPDYPLVVEVGLALDDVLAPVHRLRAWYFTVGGLLTAAVVALCWLLARETKKRRERDIAAVAAAAVREQKALLDRAVGNILQGLVMFDSEGRLVFCNSRYLQIYGLTSEQVRPGCTIRELLVNRAAGGTSVIDDIDAYIDELLAAIAQGKAISKITKLRDGRTIAVVNHPVAQGGWVATHEDITEKVEVEQEKEEKKHQLAAALSNVPQGVCMFDAEQRLIVCNERYANLYQLTIDQTRPGTPLKEILAHRVVAGTAPQDHEGYVRDRVNEVTINQPYQTINLLRDGRYISVVHRPTAEGGWVATHNDVTEALRREESFRLLFDANPMPMWVLDCETLRFLAVNEAAIAHYGYDRDQFMAITSSELHAPEKRDKVASYMRGLSDDHSAGIGLEHYKSDGTKIDVTIYSRMLTYQGRKARLAVIHDITERKRSEEELRRTREFLDTIIENVPVTILVKDAHSLKYVRINRAAEKLWGLSRDEVIGKTPHELFNREEADRIVEQDRKLTTAPTDFYLVEHRLHTPRGGIRLVRSNRIRICDDNGDPRYLLSVVKDVTDRKAVEDQLRQAQKMEAIGNLTGGIAHDFNNLLTIILGNLDLLRDEVAGNASAEETINVVMQAGERGADLARHMLTFSRRQPLQAKRVDVNALIASTIRLIGRTLGNNIAVEVNTSSDLPSVLVDPSQLQTALLNMALNARDAMPNGGTLRIAARVAELDDAYAKLHPGVVAGSYAAIEITDCGTGIAPEAVEHIFEPFFTTKPKGQGTGLGLSMVYGFIKQSGGHINVYSEVGRGTVFKLYLPLTAALAAPAAAPSAAPRAAKAVGNEVILAVEDNPDIRATVVRQLRDFGYRVLEAENADVALRILDAGGPIDLLFTDMIMPGEFNGKQLAIKARAKRANLKVLFTSGFPGNANGQDAQLEPGDAFLSKPYHQHDLAKAVEQALSRAA